MLEPGGGAEVFAPLACVLPDMDGARLALAGLSTAAGKSHLHVISSGLPRLARRYQWDWTPGLSWWLRDSSGNWHVAMADEPRIPDDGMPAYPLDDGMQVFWLRLTPPLATISDEAEIVVTGPATRAAQRYRFAQRQHFVHHQVDGRRRRRTAAGSGPSTSFRPHGMTPSTPVR